jgi:hypothetical protein
MIMGKTAIIRYRANLTEVYTYNEKEPEVVNTLCQISHIIDLATLQTVYFEYYPVEEKEK